MRFRIFASPIRPPLLRCLTLIAGLLLGAAPALAANAIVKDGNTIQLTDATYRLDGIDAPELDQICIDDHADPWSCGVDARGQLAKLVAGHVVHCEDRGPDPAYKKRRLGICTVEGDTTSLNQSMVRLGFAMNAEPPAKGSFGDDEAAARAARKGLWQGCLVAPLDFRLGNKDGPLLGGACPADKDKEIRSVLFPEFLAMPPRCTIKAKFAVRARVTGNVGIYHLQGCPSYPATTKPDRWFCTEDDAQAAGFRRAYNCRAGK
jgi:endonuclease YncB( thermonuclease family)